MTSHLTLSNAIATHFNGSYLNCFEYAIKTPWVSRILKINIQEWLSIIRLPLPYWEIQVQNYTDIMTLKFHENEKLVHNNFSLTANHVCHIEPTG